jgi:transcription elongation factor GreA
MRSEAAQATRAIRRRANMGTTQHMGQHLGWEDPLEAIPERSRRSAPVLTAEGRRKLEERARRIEEEVLPGLVEHGWADDEDGSRRIRYAAESARLQTLRTVLLDAEPADVGAEDRLTVGIGDHVVLQGAGRIDERYMIVHPAEADVDEVRISSASPLARALIGQRPGDTVEISAPGGAYRCQLLRWEGSGAERHLVARVLRTTGRRADRPVR